MLEAFIGCLFALVTFSLAIYTIQLWRQPKESDPGAGDPALKSLSDLNEKMMEVYKDAEARAAMWHDRCDGMRMQREQAVRQRNAAILIADAAVWRLPEMHDLALTFEDSVSDEDVLRPMHFAFPSGAIRCGLEEMGDESQISTPLRITTFRNAVTCDCCRTGLQIDRLTCWRCGQKDPNAEGVAHRSHTCDPGPRKRAYASVARPGDHVTSQPDT